MAAMKLPVEQRFVLSNVDWDTYVTISDKLGERYIRLTYNGADLEFRTLSSVNCTFRDFLIVRHKRSLLGVIADEVEAWARLAGGHKPAPRTR